MAKNKRDGDFDRFKSGGDAPAATADSPVIGSIDLQPGTTVPVGDDKAGIDEPTDIENQPPLGQGQDDPQADQPTEELTPLEQQQIRDDAMKAQTIAEQEEILAKLVPKQRLDDPAEAYNRYYHRAAATGQAIPEVKFKEGTDPLLIEAYKQFERLMAGRLLQPTASGARRVAVEWLHKVRNERCE